MRYFLLIFLNLFSFLCFGQPPYESGAGTLSNAFPYSTATNRQTQVIYTPGEFTPSLVGQPGTITKLWIYTNTNSTTSTFADFRVKMGTSAATVFTNTTWETGLTEVYYMPSITFTGIVAGGYLEITLTTPFYWDGVNSLIVELSQTGQTGGFNLQNNGNNGNKRKFGPVASPVAANFGAGQSRIGLTMAPPSCTGMPNTGVVAATNVNPLICGDGTSLDLNNATNGIGISYQWQKSEDNGVTWINVGNNATSLNLNSVVVPTMVRAQTHCLNSNQTATSNIVNLNVTPIDIDIDGETVICENATLDLSVAQYNPIAVIWDDNSNNITRTITQPGIYSVAIELANTCKASSQIEVFAGEEPLNNLLANYDFCEGSQLLLDAGNPGMDFLWSTNTTQPNLTVTQPGNYSVTVTSDDLCSKTFNTRINERPLPILMLPDSGIICPGDSFFVDATAQHGLQYNWSNLATGPIQYLKDEGTYTVVVASDFNCITEGMVTIVHKPLPLTNGFTFVPGFLQDMLQVRFAPINGTNITAYLWDFGDGNTSTNPTPVHKYSTFGNYSVKLTVFNECNETQYEQTIEIKDERVTSIQDIDGRKVSIYPNPTQNLINITSTANIKEVKIFSVDGKIQPNIIYANNQVNVAHLPTGYYMCTMQFEDGKQTVIKLVINR